MCEETVGFVGGVDPAQRESRSTLMESDFAFLNEPLAAHYGVEGVTWELRLRPVPVRASSTTSAGCSRTASVLVGNSTGSAPHPIYRAVWLREAILGDDRQTAPRRGARTFRLGRRLRRRPQSRSRTCWRRHRHPGELHRLSLAARPVGHPVRAVRRDRDGSSPRVPEAPASRVRPVPAKDKPHRLSTPTGRYLDGDPTRSKWTADARVPHGPEIDGLA